jgi:uncharacterized protein YlzI (FlbEa/FlbD family)
MLIKFTKTSGKNVYINPERLDSVDQRHDHIVLGVNGEYFLIKENEDEVIEKLYGKQLNNLTRTGEYERI